MLGYDDFKDSEEMVTFLNKYSESLKDEKLKDKFNQISMYIKVMSRCLEYKNNERYKQNKAINGKAHKVMAKRT